MILAETEDFATVHTTAENVCCLYCQSNSYLFTGVTESHLTLDTVVCCLSVCLTLLYHQDSMAAAAACKSVQTSDYLSLTFNSCLLMIYIFKTGFLNVNTFYFFLLLFPLVGYLSKFSKQKFAKRLTLGGGVDFTFGDFYLFIF